MQTHLDNDSIPESVQKKVKHDHSAVLALFDFWSSVCASETNTPVVKEIEDRDMTGSSDESFEPSDSRPKIWEKAGTVVTTAVRATKTPEKHCLYKMFPEVPYWQCREYHKCQEDCPGHRQVGIRHEGHLRIHHWIPGHERYRNGQIEVVQGHYRMNRK